MDVDIQESPQKLAHKLFLNYQPYDKRKSIVSACNKKTTPKSASFKKLLNPRSPKTISYSVAACSSMVSGNNSSLQSISMAVAHTPPAKRYHRVKNPFEAALAERLHLPLIGSSPSLFQRPNTPQMSSTQFEWTIDEVSSLKPANVEPHETQFQDSPDPDLEAKAQSAISSYFKDQQIVPSPIDCSLRSQRIILSEINGNTPISKPGRRIRDCAAQTELTLPPVLPPALEEALKPYLQPHLAGSNSEFKKFESSRSWRSNNEIKDISLRRKLFDMHNIVVLENENTPQQQSAKNYNNSCHSNSSPLSLKSFQNTAIVGKLSDSIDKSSFGSLSPISASDSLSPNCHTPSATNRKNRFINFLGEVDELLSPIHPPVRSKASIEKNRSQYRNQTSDISKNGFAANNLSTSFEGEENEQFTPERSSSPLNKMNGNMAEFSTDSFNIKVSRLKVNSSQKQMQTNVQDILSKTEQKSLSEIDFLQHDDTLDMLEHTGDIDEMQISQSDTPRGKRRSASRKNLSQSFTASWLEDDEEEELEAIKIKEVLARKQFGANPNKTVAILNEVAEETNVDTTPKKASNFHRIDSGFNELSQNSMSSCEAKSQEIQQSTVHQQQHDILV